VIRVDAVGDVGHCELGFEGSVASISKPIMVIRGGLPISMGLAIDWSMAKVAGFL